MGGNEYFFRDKKLALPLKIRGRAGIRVVKKASQHIEHS
jgi:hypothetical protein